MMKVTAIFDIGKTNKKYFLFDEQFNEVHKDYVCIDEVKDEDGDPCDDLTAIVNWIRLSLDKIMLSDKYELEAINFTTYGASLVHLDRGGNPLTPLYNYLKPFPNYVLANFHSKYGDSMAIAQETSSPALKMLNCGLQLYWMKYAKPEMFRKIHCSLHFPQYLSYVFTGEPYTEYTGLGCHTMLWNFSRNNYHRWVYTEGVDRLLAPIVSSDQSVCKEYKGKNIRVGIGIHDSSAALLPYLHTNKDPFLLLSTGTWSIALNPFNEEPMTREHLEQDCLNFLRTDGRPVRASRLFLGEHLTRKLQELNAYFNMDDQAYKSLTWKQGFQSKRANRDVFLFNHNLLDPKRFDLPSTYDQDFSIFEDYEDALFHLLDELTDLQIASLEAAIGNTEIKRIYVDGGFSANVVFVQFLANKLKKYEVYTSSFPLGTALGAALIVSGRSLSETFLSENYHTSLIKPRS